MTFGKHDPGDCSLFLDAGLSGPVIVVDRGKFCFDFVELGDLGPSRRSIARASGAERPGEIGNRPGRRKLGTADRQLCGLIPLPAFKRKAGGYSG